MQAIYSNTMLALTNTKPDIIYFAVGCCMGHYADINSSNNQENPKFMEKYAGKKKFYILMDPVLETPLKLESQMPLIQTDTEDNYRVFENDEYCIVAINKEYHFYDNECDMTFLHELVNYVIGTNIKMIVQNYTGCNISESYTKLFNFYDKYSLLKNILFDVTQNDGGCFINFNDHPIYYDGENNFIQDKFMPLVKMVSPECKKNYIVSRLNLISYEIVRFIRKLNGEIPMEEYDEQRIKNIIENLFQIYPIESEITIENLRNIIDVVIKDVSDSLEIPYDSIIQYIKDNNYDQKIITNTLSTVKSLVL